MLTIVLCVLIFLGGSVFIWHWLGRSEFSAYPKDPDLCTWAWGVWLAVCSVLCLTILNFVGFGEKYAEGERIGYIVKESKKGLIFKTYEIEVQMGSGQQASLQPAVNMSVSKQEVIDLIPSNLGKAVRVKYNQWLIQPITKGGSKYEVTEVNLVEEKLEKP